MPMLEFVFLVGEGGSTQAGGFAGVLGTPGEGECAGVIRRGLFGGDFAVVGVTGWVIVASVVGVGVAK